MRNQLQSLSGMWKILQDPDNTGREKGWQHQIPERDVRDIFIPGNLPQKAFYMHYAYSRIFPGYHGMVWFYRTLEAPAQEKGNRFLVEFDNAGFLCRIWMNGQYLGEHRQHEEKFALDATAAVKWGEENLLAVQCFEPKIHGEVIEGIVLSDIPNGSQAYGDYDNEPTGGLMGEVRVRIVPQVRIEDVYVRPNAETGEVELQITLQNEDSDIRELHLEAKIFEQKHGEPVTHALQKIEAVAGCSVHIMKLQIKQHKLWDIENPALYMVQVEAGKDASKLIRFGFKDFRVKDGFFFLNGRRIFLKCAHCSQEANSAIGMKNMGFNTIRMLTRAADPELLDLCDELGLLMIDSALTAWGMLDHENTRQQIFDYNDALVKGARNHACLAGYYMFNELPGNDGDPYIMNGRPTRQVFIAGVDYLKRLRELDPDHMALLSSGRWDRESMIGSISNPGSMEWEFQWGAEGMSEEFRNTLPRAPKGANCQDMGDIHPYVTLPMPAYTRNWYRTLAANTMPVFISEEGWGSQSDPVRRYMEILESGASKESIYARQYRQLWGGLEEFMNSNGFSNLYPFTQDFVYDTYMANERQRQQVFDVIRSNPKLCGYSLTSWGSYNEGTLEGDTILKPGQAHILQEGWAPLRWALFTTERAVYANKPFEVEAVLCNEDRLKPGSYKAIARIHGKQGIVWEKEFDAVYPEEGYGNMPPLAATVLKETVTLPAGEYTFAVRMLEGAAPYGGNLPVTVLEPTANLPSQVSVLGVDAATEDFLKAQQVEVVDAAKLILAGANITEADLKILQEKAKNGANVLFLRTEPFIGERNIANPKLTAIAGEEARCIFFRNWLYHMDNLHIPSPVFNNLPETPLLNMELYGDVYPSELFLDMKKADTVLTAGIMLNGFIENNCARSLTLSEYKEGEGRLILNAFLIEQNLGKHPIADQLFMNMLENYSK